MKAESNKAINRVTKARLKPLGFERLADRMWVYDGGWWILTVYFQPSASGGSYTELGVNPLCNWITGGLLGGVDAPRNWAPMDDATKFESSLNEMLDELIPIALNIITSVTTPAQMLSCERVKLMPRFGKGIVQALSRDLIGARETFGQFHVRPDIEWSRVEARHMEIALKLFDREEDFYDFVDLLILRSRVAIGGPISERPPLPYPWKST